MIEASAMPNPLDEDEPPLELPPADGKVPDDHELEALESAHELAEPFVQGEEADSIELGVEHYSDARELLPESELLGGAITAAAETQSWTSDGEAAGDLIALEGDEPGGSEYGWADEESGPFEGDFDDELEQDPGPSMLEDAGELGPDDELGLELVTDEQAQDERELVRPSSEDRGESEAPGPMSGSRG